jgi:hypothetical protein
MIRITRKRLVITTLVLLLLLGILVVTWEVCDWPPPRMILKYGFPPAGGPTGRRVVHQETTFLQIAPGYRRLERKIYEAEGTPIGDLLGGIGVKWGKQSIRDGLYECRWVEVEKPYWISVGPFTGTLIHDDNGGFQTMRPMPGTLRRPTVDQLWFAYLTATLRAEKGLVLNDSTGDRVRDQREPRAYLIGSQFGHHTGHWKLHPHGIEYRIFFPLVWLPPRD